MQASSFQIMDSMSIEGHQLSAGWQHTKDPTGKEAGGGKDRQEPLPHKTGIKSGNKDVSDIVLVSAKLGGSVIFPQCLGHV